MIYHVFGPFRPLAVEAGHASLVLVRVDGLGRGAGRGVVRDYAGRGRGEGVRGEWVRGDVEGVGVVVKCPDCDGAGDGSGREGGGGGGDGGRGSGLRGGGFGYEGRLVFRDRWGR